MKKILLLSVILLFQLGFSQSKIDVKSPILKEVKVDKIEDAKFDYINNAQVLWDFTSVDLKGKQVSIEVVTIYDCFNGENASDFKETINVLSEENFTVSGFRDLIHLDLLAKCFKWRILSVENGETKVSEWSYLSFLK